MNLSEIKNLNNKHIILKNINNDCLGVLHPVDIRLSLRYNDISTLSFKIYKDTCQYWNLITSYRKIELEGLMDFIISNPQIINDGLNEYIQVECKSYEIDINRKSIPYLSGTYKFYSILPEDETICSIILSRLPNWSIESVSASLWNIYRTFDVQNIPLYDFLKNEVSPAFEAVFEFNTIQRTIKIVAFEDIPKKTDIYLSHDNLINELSLAEKTEEIHTVLTVFGSGDLSINLVNILGSTIYNFNHFLNQDGFMSGSLKTAVVNWQNEIDTQQPIYANYLTQRATKLSELITLQTELTELEGQKKALEIARDALLDSGLDATSKNAEVRAKQTEITNKETQIDNKQAEIDNIDDSLQAIQNTLSLTSYFDSEQLEELEPFIIQTSITDENFVTVSTDSELDKQNTAQDLYDKYKKILDDNSKLKYEFSVDLLNYLTIDEYENFVNQSEWGSQVTLKINDKGDLVYPMLLGLDIDWNDNIDIQYLFSTEVRLSDAMQEYDLSNDVSNMSNKMVTDGVKWSQYVNSGDKDRVFDLFTKGLQTDLTEIKNSENEELLINGQGLLGRRLNENGNYDDEQIRLLHNRLAFTKDGWDSLATVIGKVTLPDDTQAYGVNAEVIIGNLIAGNQLVISNANNSFIVDADSARLTNSYLSIEKGVNKILLDPTNGFKIQKDTIDMIYLDAEGNANFKGIINASTIKGGSIYIGGAETESNCVFGVSADGKILGIEAGDGLVIDEYGNATFTGDINLLGNLRMGGNITWDAPVVQYQYSVDNLSWHTTMTSNDKYRRESWDGGTTWQTGYQFVGIDGINGQDGSDANVPNYIQSTYIGNTKILSPEIIGGVFYATGQGRLNEAAYYIYDGVSGTGDNAVPINLKGYISYDTDGAGTTEEAKNRVFFKTVDDIALKIESGGAMSLEALNGRIHIMSDVSFYGNVSGVSAKFA